MIQFSDVYQIGVISKTHALKGEVIFNFTDDVFDTEDADYIIINVDGILVPFFIEEYRFRNDSSVILKIEDIDSADAAQTIIGCDVYFEKSKVKADFSDQVSLKYFIGFKIENHDAQQIGTIIDIDDNTENWLFITETANGDEVLIPAHDELITDIDNDNHVITMKLPEGLLDL